MAIGHEDGERTVIEGLSYHVAEGEALAIVGESGSGKSLMAMGPVDLLPPGCRAVEGRTTFLGEVLQDLDDPTWRRLVGMGIGVLFQNALGSWDPIQLIGPQSGEVLEEHTELTLEEIERRVRSALGDVRLPQRWQYSSFVHELSRGQAQRAMLAATLLSAPRMLVADEPLSGLDVSTARSVLSLIDDMRRERRMGMLLVTHDLGVVASVADRVAIVYGGMVVEEAPVEVLFTRPRHPYAAGLLACTPGLARGRLEPIPGEAPELLEVPEGCPFAPRCRYAVPECSDRRPAVRDLGESRVACLLADSLSFEGVVG